MAHLKIPTGKKMKREKTHYLRLAVLFFVLTVIHGCDATDPNNTEKLYIEVAEVSCTESWIKVETSEVNFPVELKLYRDSELIQEITVNEKSTVIYDSLLSPSQSYKYQAKLPGISSQEITATTLDTTSHNFNWQTYTFGEHASSVLYDVAIIDENNIWAVGQIYMYDSTGTVDPHAYNAVHWDGEDWTLHRIMFYTICGQQSRTSYPARTIFAFSENEIWVAGGGRQLAKISGTIHLETICPPFSIFINKIWGTSSENVYVVGDNGNIARYDGSTWQKIESGIDLPIQDIWGTYNEETNDYEIMCIASDKYYGGGPEVFLIKSNNAIPQSVDGLSWSISSIWFKDIYRTYIAGDGIYIKTEGSTDQEWKNIMGGITNYYMHSISGNGLNDIFFSGSGGEIVHFNGSTWKNYTDENVGGFYGNLYRITAKDNIVCAVGSGHISGHQAVIIFGKR